jgi:hypothetical protein
MVILDGEHKVPIGDESLKIVLINKERINDLVGSPLRIPEFHLNVSPICTVRVSERKTYILISKVLHVLDHDRNVAWMDIGIKETVAYRSRKWLL